MGLKRFTSKAFTLIELMLVVAIIGLLSAIALPKFANLVIKAKGAALKGKLGALRSAISIYYADNEGRFPILAQTSNWSNLTTGARYLDAPLRASIPTYPAHVEDIGFWSNPGTDWLFNGDNKAWLYISGTGKMVVNCLHTDSGGITWSLW